MIRRYPGATVHGSEELRDRVAQVYAAVFGEPPYGEPPERGHDWAHGPLVRHSTLAGFELVCAEQDGRLVGFGYGALGREDSWFDGYIRDHAPREVWQRWLAGHGELAELAVLPGARGRGLGGVLHDAVLEHLAGAGADRAILVTQRAATAARALYAARGWRDLAELAPGSMLMGVDLDSQIREHG